MLEFGAFAKDLLITGVEEEDERDDGVGSSGRSVDGVLRGADGLQDEEEQHAAARSDEEQTTTKTLDSEGSTDGPEQIPDGEDTIKIQC